jgi:hypothetical protein
MKWRDFLLFLLLAVPLLATSAAPSFGGPIYQWTDEEGNIGFTDDPARIPAKYRRNAILENSIPKDSDKNRASEPNPPASTPEAPPLPSEEPTDAAGHDETFWRERIERLRDEQERLSRTRNKLALEAESLSNPLTSSRGEERARYQELQGQLAELDLKIADIETQITVSIPEEARKLNVPPGWLRE